MYSTCSATLHLFQSIPDLLISVFLQWIHIVSQGTSEHCWLLQGGPQISNEIKKGNMKLIKVREE